MSGGVPDFPWHLAPMLAVPGMLPEQPEAWGFEYKWDGIRALAYWQDRRFVLESRNQLEITARYPELSDLGPAVGRRAWILDGEIVSLDADGRPSFGRLQQRMHASPEHTGFTRLVRRVPAYYFVFDLLFLDSQPCLNLPYRERRAVLAGMDLRHSRCRVTPWHAAEGGRMLATARQYGLEGLVAKRLDSAYRPGIRSPAWIKIKLVRRQEFVIAGWSPSEREPGSIASLLVGVYDEQGRLHYAGSVGTGFDRETQAELLTALRPRQTPTAAFLSSPGRKPMIPVRPELVAEVAYHRWPAGGLIQQASFKGLRWDKLAKEVKREPIP